MAGSGTGGGSIAAVIAEIDKLQSALADDIGELTRMDPSLAKGPIATKQHAAKSLESTRQQLVLRPLDYVTKLVSGLLACELPLDSDPVAIHATGPGPSLLAQASDVSDSAFA